MLNIVQTAVERGQTAALHRVCCRWIKLKIFLNIKKNKSLLIERQRRRPESDLFTIFAPGSMSEMARERNNIERN